MGRPRGYATKSRLARMRRFVRRSPGATFAVAGLVAIGYGAAQIAQGKVSYENYWGGLVFAPLVIVFGIFMVYVGLFRRNALSTAFRDKKGRPVRFPADDFRKW